MKIRTENQQPAAAAQPVEQKPGHKESAAPHKTSRSPRGRQDTVELSAALDAELKSQQADQAQRVDAIKARVAAGEYQVSSRAVAEKMLKGSSES